MTQLFGSSFNKRMLAIKENMEQRSELSRSIASFMLSVSEIIGDSRLAKVTNLFWDPNSSPDPDRMHRFNCRNTTALEFPLEMYAGELIVPNHVYMVIEQQEISYHISQDLDDEFFRELTLVISNPRDVVSARWEATIADYGQTELGDHASLPGDKFAIDNSDFSIISNVVQASLLGVRPKGAVFVRERD